MESSPKRVEKERETMQDNYTKCETKAAAKVPFNGHTMRADWEGDTYTVYSYRTVIATYDRVSGNISFNETKYSRTTSRHQGVIRRAWGL